MHILAMVLCIAAEKHFYSFIGVQFSHAKKKVDVDVNDVARIINRCVKLMA